MKAPAPAWRVPVTEPFRFERAPRPSLAGHVACTWADRSSRDDPLLPDAAVELVWSGRGLFVRGADTHPHPVGVFPDRIMVGVRFRTGAAADVLGLRGHELADARVGVSELWGRAEMERLELQLAACASPVQAALLLEDIVEERVRSVPDRAIEMVVAMLETQAASARVGVLAERLGLSERQLLRRCTTALGYGPKTLARILRFQQFRKLAAAGADLCLAELAVEVGYADQPHLTRRCVRLAGETPAAHVARL